MDLYIGTLTREGGEGILHARLEENHLERLSVIGSITDPNYLILRPDGARLYAVSSDEAGEMHGCVNEYDLTAAPPRLLSRQATRGNGPCHLAFSPDGRFLYCANYGTGSIAVFPLTGGLGPAVQLVQHAGSGSHPTRQAGPHVHQVYFLPGESTLCAADLGTDALYFYAASPEGGCLTLKNRLALSGGPRHILCARSGWVYLVHELSNAVTALRREGDALLPAQTLSTLPSAYQGTNTTAAIRLSHEEDRLYVSNRGHGSIAVFSVRKEGLLHPLGHLPAGAFPRDFLPLPDGRFLVADQRSGVLLLDSRGQTLDFLPQPGAVCIAPR